MGRKRLKNEKNHMKNALHRFFFMMEAKQSVSL